MKKPKVFIEKLTAGYLDSVANGFAFLADATEIHSSDRVCIKPNLTFPHYREGVMTSLAAIEAVVRYLKDHTEHVTICESDSGGYNRFSMDEVFSTIGLYDLARKYDVEILNLSNEKSKLVKCQTTFKALEIPLPVQVVDESDLFVTMPVPKIHMNSGVSLSMKNQWGVIQEPALRLTLHPYFKHVIYTIHKHLPKTVVIMDGKYGLTRSGPMRGDPVKLNWIMMSDSVFAADFTSCHLLGIDPMRIRHLRYALQRENILDLSAIDLNTSLDSFLAPEKFYLRREWTDYPGLLTFNSRALAYIGYESPLAGILHRLLYKFREPFYDYERNK